MTSTCTKCGHVLPPGAFYVLTDGQRQGACKKCHKLAVAQWRAANRTRHNENARRWRAANRDKVKATNHAQYEKNQEARYAAGREWALAHPDKRRAAEKKWRSKPESKEISRLKAQRYRRERFDRTSASEKKWRQKHPQAICAFAKTRRARKASAPINDFTADQWVALQIAFAHRCAYCDQRCKGRLTQDHVVPLSKGGGHTASNIVPACKSCNSRKHNGPPLRPIQVPLLM